MSDSESIRLPISPEFSALCEAQMALLSQSLGAVWSAVYLTQTQEHKNNQKLVPVSVYPLNPKSSIVEDDASLSLSERQSALYEANLPNLFLNSSSKKESLCLPNSEQLQSPPDFISYAPGEYQLVIPLIAKNLFLGLLITRREDREWNHQEFEQIEKIANTVALGRLLDQKRAFAEDNFRKQIYLTQLDNDRLEDFLHQIRNPLTALRTFIKLLLKKLLPGDSHYSIAQNMLQQTERIEDLITDFKVDVVDDYSKSIISPPNVPSFFLPSHSFAIEKFSVIDILQPILNVGKAIAQEKNIELREKIADNLPLVLGSKKGLREILNNLLDNALKYTPSGGIVQVEVGEPEIIDNRKRLAIRISDTGYGISAEDQEQIFERHYRGAQTESDISGNGLGLAIVKELCAKMQAKIKVISPSLLENKQEDLPGTTFIVWLRVSETGTGNGLLQEVS
jgi:signal transduction histidine kinase